MLPTASARSAQLHQIVQKAKLDCLKWKKLNAFITECWDVATDQAECLSHSPDINGPLAGQLLAVKDNFCTKGVKTSCGSHMLDNFYPPYTATVVERLEAAGMLLVGKTNMDTYGMGTSTLDGVHGPVQNPWTYSPSQSTLAEGDFRLAGGSSGGSAAAVAAGIVYGALGSDTGGSVRNPAALCGVVGLKPTYGLLSRHGLVPLTNSTDCPGIISQTVENCTHILNATAGHDPKDSTTYHSREFEKVELTDTPSVEGLRVGIPREYHLSHTTHEVVDTWTQLTDFLTQSGAVVEELSLPHTKYALPCYFVINFCEVASNMARYDGIEYGHRANAESSTEALYAQTRHEAFNHVVRGRIFAGNYFLLRSNYDNYYMKAAKVRRLIYDEFMEAFEKVDVLLTPVTLSDSPLHSQMASIDKRREILMQDVCTTPSSLAGLPAISVPVKLSRAGLPIGMQLIGRHFDEQTLLSTAHFLDKHYQCPRFSDVDRGS